MIAMWQTLSRSKLFSTRTLIIVPLSSLWLPWHQFELDAWSWLLASFSVRDTKYLSVGFIFRISRGKDSSRLLFGSSYSTPSWIFRKYRIVGVSWRWFPRPRRPKIDRGKKVFLGSCAGLLLSARPSSTLSNSFFICSLEVGFLPFLGFSTLAMLPVFWGLLQML